jgi:hypothetical protein
MTDALRELAAQLGEEDTPISGHVVASPPAAEDALFVEAVREGYLLHYEEPRLLSGQDEDLALLAGDYLYALGIERLAALGDVGSILVLADLIGDCAQLHAEGRGDEAPARWARALAALGGAI